MSRRPEPPSSFGGDDLTFRRGRFLGGEWVMCSKAAAMLRPRCKSWTVASASGLVFEGPGCKREPGKSKRLMGHLPSPRAARKLEGSSNPGLRGFAQTARNSGGKAALQHQQLMIRSIAALRQGLKSQHFHSSVSVKAVGSERCCHPGLRGLVPQFRG